MSFRNVAVVGVVLALVVGFALVVSAADRSVKKVKKVHDPAVAAVHLSVTDGKTHPTTRGTAWVTYDDGTREWWADNWAPESGAAGNKFTSTWGTFYCDMISAYAVWTGTGSSLYFSAWTGTTNGGADLGGNTYTYLGSLTTSGSGWAQIDGSSSPWGFVGNSSVVFSNTAWLGVWVSSSGAFNKVGIDTSGTGGHGFYLDYYSGSGYHETGWNAMVRARFNGDAVPVELAGFTVE